jgi:hypothetical protein
MAGEFGECVEAHIEELVAGEDWEALEEAMDRLHAVEIPIELAGEGMEAAMEGTGAPREEWAAHIGSAADACWEAHHDTREHDHEDDHEDWHDPAMSLGFCIDSHGNGDGELNAVELIGAFEQLKKADMIGDELFDELMAEKPEDIKDEDVVEWDHAGDIIEFILEHEEVPREEWAASVAEIAEKCWEAHFNEQGTTTGPPPAGPPSTTGPPPAGSAPSTTDVPATALAQIKAKYGRL